MTLEDVKNKFSKEAIRWAKVAAETEQAAIEILTIATQLHNLMEGYNERYEPDFYKYNMDFNCFM